MILRWAPYSLALPVFFWVSGLAAGLYLEISFPVLIAIMAINLALVVYCRYNLPLLLIFIFFSGMLRFDLDNHKGATHLDTILANRREVKGELEGRITRVISAGHKISNYELQVNSIAGEKVNGSIYLQAAAGLQTGSEVRGTIQFEKPEGARNPWQKDRRLSYRLGGFSGFGRAVDSLQVLSGEQPGINHVLLRWIEKRLRKRCGDLGEYALALTTGRTGGIDWTTRTAIRRAGLSHLFAVSGLHVGIIAFVLYSLLMLAFPYRATRIVLIFLLIGYGFLCNWSASVTRAVLMLVLYTLCVMKERAVNLNQILLLSLIVITLISPAQTFSAGLQLSFAATFILINLSPLLESKFFRKGSSRLGMVIKRFLQSIILTIAVVLFIAPLSLAHFGEFSANGIIGIFPAALLFGILLPLSFTIIILPWGAEAFIYSYRFLVQLFLHWVNIVAELPFCFLYPDFRGWQAVLIYLLLGAAIYNYGKRARLRALILVLLIPGVFFVTKIREKRTSELEIYCLDCGQGDMSYLELPGGESILIDTGPVSFSRGEGMRGFISWVQGRGVASLDQVIITHAHNDHYGGLEAIFGALRVKSLVTGAGFMADIEDAGVKRAILEENLELITISDTLSLWLGETRFQFLHPDREFVPDSVNNGSLVVRVSYGEFEGLFTGDIERVAESWLCERYVEQLSSDFIKASHHGSNSSNTEEFIEAAGAGICFIPAGKNNRFRFPHQAVLERYSYLGEHLVNGAEDGALIIRTDGQKCSYRVMLRDGEFCLELNNQSRNIKYSGL
jgi:competence protein ComEC